MILFFFALFFAAFPEYLIKNIEDSQYYDISHQLLFILALTFPLSIIQKFSSLIYSVRIEEYRIQSFQIVGSIFKIVSVPLYFFNNRYDIVGYYLFCEILNLLINLLILFYSKNIGYGFRAFFKCLKFDKLIFHEIKPLALSGFASVVGWVTYYELDTAGISILLGANAVAIYAVAKQVQSFLRSIIGILFSPYPVRINYFIGQKDYDGLKAFYYKLVEEFSFVIIPIVTIVLFAKPFISAWLGYDYKESVLILQLLALTFLLHYITSQASSVIYGLNKVKDVLKIAFIQPVLFWIGVLSTYSILGVKSFAIFQLVACLITEFLYCYLAWKYLKYTKIEFLWNLMLKPLVIISCSCTLFWYLSSTLMSDVCKGHQDLIYVVFIMGLCCLFGFIVDIIFNKALREESAGMINMIRNRNNNGK
jgi:O-antigen/teichoic acid export membrane protein